MSRFAWGTVDSVEPLRIRVDGDADPLPFTPDALVDPRILTPGDRVRLELADRRVIVLGRAGGDAAAFLRGLDNLCINGDFRINQRGYTSGTALTPGLFTGFGHDRWRTAGIANLIPNPRAFSSATWSGSSASHSRITGVTIPGLPGVTTAHRATFTTAAVGGIYTQGDIAAPHIIPIVGGMTYRVSIWLRSSVAKSIQPSIQFSGAPTTNYGSPVALAANTWTEVAYTFTAPYGAVRAGLFWYSTAAWAVGNTLDGTAAIMTEGAAVVPFFDGDTTGCAFVSTARQSPSVNRPAATSYTFTQTPNGCTITINSGGAIQQVLERANVPAGTYTVSWAGTARARVYGATSLSLLALADTPVTFAADGTEDVVLEFEAVSGAATLSNVNLVSGSAGYPYRQRPLGEELALAQRYYQRIQPPIANDVLFVGQMVTSTIAYVTYSPPTTFRGSPRVNVSGLTDLAVYRPGVSPGSTATWASPIALHPYLVILSWTAVSSTAFVQAIIMNPTAGPWVEMSAELTT